MEFSFNTVVMLILSILAIIIGIRLICGEHPKLLRFSVITSITLTILMVAVLGIGFVVLEYGKPNINEKEDTYEIIGRTEQYKDAAIFLKLFENPDDTEGITYSDGQETIEEKISRMPKAYDLYSVTDYVAKMRCYFGPLYTLRDCYVYGGNKTQQKNT